MKRIVATVAGVCMGVLCARADVYCCVNTNSAGFANDGVAFADMGQWENAAGEHPSAWSADHELSIDASKCHSLRRLSWYPGAGATLGKMTSPSPSMEFIITTGSSTHPQYVLEVDDPNDFQGIYRFDLPRMELLLKPHGSFVPRINQLSPIGHTFVNVEGEGSAKIGLVKGMKSFEAEHYGDAEARWNGANAGAYFGDAALEKTGAGDLELEATGGRGLRLYVSEGSLTLDGRPSELPNVESVVGKAWLHLDATRPDTMQGYVDAAGRTCVTNWASANGSGVSAWFPSDYVRPYASEDLVPDGGVNPPFVSTAASGTGRALMDFGGVTGGDNPLHGVLRFPDIEAAEVFVVKCLTERGAAGNPVLGHTTECPFHTDGLGVVFNEQADVKVRDGELYLNGVTAYWCHDQLDAYRRNFSSLQVLNSVPTGPVTVNLLGSDRWLRGGTGGCRVGEVLVFTQKLTESERRSVNDYLMKKWIAGYVPCDAEAMTLKAGTSVRVPDGRVAYVRRLSVPAGGSLVKTGGGTLVVTELSPADATLDVRGGSVRVNPEKTKPSSLAPAPDRYCWLDASEPSTLVTSNDTQTGKTYVTRWNDRDGGEVYADLPADRLDIWFGNAPTLVAGVTPTGKPALDFGLWSLETGASWFTMRPYGDKFVREAFLVFRPSANVWGNIFDTRDLGMINNNSVGSGTTLVSPEYGSATPSAASWAVDGGAVNPWDLFQSLGSGDTAPFHIVSLAGATKMQIDLIAKDRDSSYNSGFGQKQVCELILYDRPLTEQERRDTEAYLMEKWNGAAHPASASATYAFADGAPREFANESDIVLDAETGDRISGGTAAVVKRGRGDLEIRQTVATTDGSVDGGSYAVSEGATLSVHYDYPVQPLYRFDASAASTFSDTYETDDGTYFKTWADACGGTAVATANIGGTASTGMTNAHLVARETAPGVSRTVAHFGGGNAADSARMFLDATYQVAEAFAFEADVNYGGARNVLFGCNGGSYEFLRSWESPRGLVQNYTGTEPVVNGFIAVDGVERDYTYHLEDNSFYLLNFVPTQAVPINRIAADRNSTAGGLMIGEQLAFGQALSDKRRAAVTSALLHKWKGVGEQPIWTNAVGSVTLTDGSTLRLSAEDAFVDLAYGIESLSGTSGTLALGGRTAVGLSEISTAGGFAVEGRVALASAGRVTLDVSTMGRLPKSGRLPILTAASVSGLTLDWQLEVIGGAKRSWRLASDESGLYAEFESFGLLITIQ